MSYRGRGRGRGGRHNNAKQDPYILFPDIELPRRRPIGEVSKEEFELIVRNASLQSYWKSSPYYIESPSSKKNEDTEIERFSDRRKTKAARQPLSYHLKLTRSNFPLELIHGPKRAQPDQRKVCWNPEKDLQKLDMMMKFEEKNQNQEKAEESEEEEENIEEDDEMSDDDYNQNVDLEDDEMSDDDYNQNVDFDDDEDDYNVEEDNDEATYD